MKRQSSKSMSVMLIAKAKKKKLCKDVGQAGVSKIKRGRIEVDEEGDLK